MQARGQGHKGAECSHCSSEGGQLRGVPQAGRQHQKPAATYTAGEDWQYYRGVGTQGQLALCSTHFLCASAIIASLARFSCHRLCLLRANAAASLVRRDWQAVSVMWNHVLVHSASSCLKTNICICSKQRRHDNPMQIFKGPHMLHACCSSQQEPSCQAHPHELCAYVWLHKGMLNHTTLACIKPFTVSVIP